VTLASVTSAGGFKPFDFTVPFERRPRRTDLASGPHWRVYEGCLARNAESAYRRLAYRTAQAHILKLPWSAYDGQAITLSVSKRCARFAHIHQMHRRTMQNVGRDSAKLTNNTDHQDRQAIQEALLRLAVEVGD
jgi:hypothetical protein